MSNHLPSWFFDAKEADVVTQLPSWFINLNQPQETAEEMPPEVEVRAMNKGEGGFTERMLAEIRSHESPNHGYNDYFGRGFKRGPFAPSKDLTKLTINEVLSWQVASNPTGPDTSAAGAYQIIRPTLMGLVRSMGLKGDELFDNELQDRMAISLMNGRGLQKFLTGDLDGDSFANKMAREWASLPVLKEDRRGRRIIAIGQSYYRGDGVNKAFKGEKAFEQYKELYALADIGE